MKQYKPHHVLFFLVGVFALLSPIPWLMKEDSFKIGEFSFQFLSADRLMTPREEVKKDITSIVAKVDTMSIEEPEPLVQHENGSKGNLGAASPKELKGEAATTIHYKDAGREKLEAFFEKLDKTQNEKKGKVRILHYGDSQIEGDRMTAYIRQRLQEQFGGNGPGMIPAMNVYNTMTFKQTYSPNFTRYAILPGVPKLKSRRYGTMNTAARFTPEFNDIEMEGRVTPVEAFIEIEPGTGAYSRARTYNNVSLHYTSCYRHCDVRVYQNGNLIHEDSLVADGRYHTLPLNFPNTPGKLRYVFSSPVSPTFVGFTMEGDYGVQVDNIAMRGSSGTFFGKIDQGMAGRMYGELDVEMVIMQFGGNSVPWMKDSSEVRGYVNMFKGQLRTIKSLRPSAVIMVIGPSDMSTSSADGKVTFKMLPYLVDEMRKGAKDVGACYWDLYRAMGGYNSMPSWVEQGLAGSDYIHFTPKGASIASQLFFDALAAEYVKWKQGK